MQRTHGTRLFFLLQPVAAGGFESYDNLKAQKRVDYSVSVFLMEGVIPHLPKYHILVLLLI